MLRAKPLGALSALVLSEQQTKTSPGLTIPITSTFSRAYTVHTPECQAPVRRRRIRRLVSRCPFLKRVRVYLGYPEVPSRASMRSPSSLYLPNPREPTGHHPPARRVGPLGRSDLRVLLSYSGIVR